MVRNNATRPVPWTRRRLAADLRALGLVPGDSVMIHAGLRSVGPMLGGPDALILAVLDTIGPAGTLLVYTDWDDGFGDLLDPDGTLPAEFRDEVLPFDPIRSRANRDNGAIAELIRTFPGALRSGNPGASCAAIGARAAWFVADHPQDYGYGERSPFGRLVESSGKVLVVGAPLDTVSLLHHAEHKAQIPGKRVVTGQAPLLVEGRVTWCRYEEFDTSDPVVEGLDADYFGTIVTAFLDQGGGRRGRIGSAESVLLPAADLVGFAVGWLQDWSRRRET